MGHLNPFRDLEQTKTTQNNHRKLEVIGCGLFLIWIGISIQAELGWGIGLIGIGLLIIGLQVADAFLTSTEHRRSPRELFKGGMYDQHLPDVRHNETYDIDDIMDYMVFHS